MSRLERQRDAKQRMILSQASGKQNINLRAAKNGNIVVSAGNFVYTNATPIKAFSGERHE